MEKQSNEEFMWNAVALASWGALETKLLSMFIKRTIMDRVIDLRLSRLLCPDLNLRFGSWKHPGEVVATLNGHRQSSNRGTVYNCRFK